MSRRNIGKTFTHSDETNRKMSASKKGRPARVIVQGLRSGASEFQRRAYVTSLAVVMSCMVTMLELQVEVDTREKSSN